MKSMNFAKVGLGTLAAVITVSTATLSTSTSAQAAAITPGSILNLSEGVNGNVRLTGNTLDFRGFRSFLGADANQGVSVGGSTGSFANSAIVSINSGLPKIKDLTLVGAGNIRTIANPVLAFIDEVDFGPLLGPYSPLSFDLNTFFYNTALGEATFTGIFRSGSDSIAAGGNFTSQLPGFTPSSYSLSIVAVPTPALLPGLIAMGIGALRKRKKEMAAVSAEA